MELAFVAANEKTIVESTRYISERLLLIYRPERVSIGILLHSPQLAIISVPCRPRLPVPIQRQRMPLSTINFDNIDQTNDLRWQIIILVGLLVLAHSRFPISPEAINRSILL